MGTTSNRYLRVIKGKILFLIVMKLRRNQPIIIKPSVRPSKYYKFVIPYMMKFISNRKLTIIWQRNSKIGIVKKMKLKDGSKVPIVVNNERDFLKLVERGGIDFMCSVKPLGANLIDMIVLDVKANKQLWLSERGSLVMDIIIKMINSILNFAGIESTLTMFDGMNGFKVVTLLDLKDVNEDTLGQVRIVKGLVSIVNDMALRILKKFKINHDVLKDLIIGANTTLKVGMCRVPFSIHWSTKLIAVPVINNDVKNFSLIYAEPVRVIERLHIYSGLIDKLRREKFSNILNMVNRWFEKDVNVIYGLRQYVLSSVSM